MTNSKKVNIDKLGAEKANIYTIWNGYARWDVYGNDRMLPLKICTITFALFMFCT